MKFDYAADVTPGPIVTRITEVVRDSQARTERVIRYYQRGIYATVAEALASPYLHTDSERETVRLTIAE